ncbi:MAG: 4,5-DOPA dioxygenase extradiol [Bacteroidota bacterium]
MNRRKFIINSSLTCVALMNLKTFASQFSGLPEEEKLMPVLFVGHGNPMNAIRENEYNKKWKEIAAGITKPKAILCVSAHWETNGTRVTAMAKPPTIHDFGGFPEELFKTEYPAPGAPELAEETKKLVTKTSVISDHEWGLDHGTWSVLLPMFPKADIPVFQLSIDYTKDARWHYELGKELLALRKKGVLIIGSGNIVHNLGLIQWGEKAYDWAVEFDNIIKTLVEKGDHDAVIHYEKLGKSAQLAVPSNEHYLPLLYSLSLKQVNEKISWFNERTSMGSLSMRSLIIS